MNLKTAWFVIGVGAAVLLGVAVDRVYPDTAPAVIQSAIFVVKVIARLHG